ncbi:MAG: hypothetical protein J0G95_03475 [Rhizobiales bacterium]|nr:hypothetical protein [Hyphomicrobiales bacterium]
MNLSLAGLPSKLLADGKFSTPVLFLVLCLVPAAAALGLVLDGAGR